MYVSWRTIIASPILPRYEAALAQAEGGLDLLVNEMLKCMDKPFAFFGRGHGSQARSFLIRYSILYTKRLWCGRCEDGLAG